MKKITFKGFVAEANNTVFTTKDGRDIDIVKAVFVTAGGIIPVEGVPKSAEEFCQAHNVDSLLDILADSEITLYQDDNKNYRFTNHTFVKNNQVKQTSLSEIVKVDSMDNRIVLHFADGTIVVKSYTTKVGDTFYVDFYKKAKTHANLGIEEGAEQDLVGKTALYVWKQFKGRDYAEVTIND